MTGDAATTVRPRRAKRVAAGAATLVAASLLPFGTSAEGVLSDTYLLDLRQGSARSDAVRVVSRGGYALAGGEAIGFEKWYSSRWTDLHLDFLTQLTSEFAVIWGFSTGERGRKYAISPGAKLGFIYAARQSRNSSLSLSITTQLGSSLREEACIADYGGLGGIQRVNCRLAASTLPPAETLKHRLNMSGFGDSRISIDYVLNF